MRAHTHTPGGGREKKVRDVKVVKRERTGDSRYVRVFKHFNTTEKGLVSK